MPKVNPFAVAYWYFGGWYLEGVRAWQQATANAMDDRHAHFLGKRFKR